MKIADWETLNREFSKYFSTQGQSMRNLYKTWINFEFNPETNDIEEFVRNVQECAHQLGYEDQSITNMIKSCMPMSTYSSLYEKNDLPSVIAMVKDLFAKGLQAPKQDGGAAANPFSHIKGGPLDNTLNRLFDALYKLDIKPFKPYIAPEEEAMAEAAVMVKEEVKPLEDSMISRAVERLPSPEAPLDPEVEGNHREASLTRVWHKRSPGQPLRQRTWTERGAGSVSNWDIKRRTAPRRRKL